MTDYCRGDYIKSKITKKDVVDGKVSVEKLKEVISDIKAEYALNSLFGDETWLFAWDITYELFGDVLE